MQRIRGEKMSERTTGKKFIKIRGANVNNLKNLSVDIPRDEFVVLTGVSGSGKSSLAFDTIYAEGQRRYMESLSSYARQFLGQMEKPDVESIEGLPPAISIDQKSTNRNPRSTVGTVTEIYDYFRLLYARIGIPHCPKCGKEIQRQSVDQIVDQIMRLPEKARFQILSPVVRGKKGEHTKVLDDARRGGYVRARIDESIYDLSEEIKLDKNKKHHIDVVVDRLVMKPDLARRLTDSVETALSLSGGLVILNEVDGDKDTIFSQNYACEDCGISLPELSPRMFSFNNPYGACPVCSGLGTQLVADPDLVIPDWDKSILDGAIQASGFNNVKDDSIARMYFEALAKKYHFSLTTPMKDLPKDALHAVLYGTGKENLTIYYERANGRGTLERPFEGVLNNVSRRLSETQSDAMRKELEECMSERPCPKCHGNRLSDISLAVTVGGMNIMDFCRLPVSEALDFMESKGLKDCLKLIHFHIGSQVTKIRRIKTALREASQFYVQLHAMGFKVEFVDIGGGLGVDYDGTRSSNSEGSVNYSIQEYVNDSISTLVDVSDKNGIPHPNIITESGRALTAHHSVLIFEVLETATLPEWDDEEVIAPDAHELVQELYGIWDSLNQNKMLEAWHDAQQIREEALDLFSHGIVDLKTRAQIERLYWSITREINQIAEGLKHAPDEFRGLSKLLADKYFCNFSLFQSLPDSWAIDQIFPIMPIQRLDEKPDRSATLQDITCDSDGKIANFISTRNVAHYLPVHALKKTEPYYVAVFLVGAYQEILGDMHNLFGDTNAVHVSVNEKGYNIEQIIDGETVAEVLDYVQYNPKKLVRTLETWVTKSVKEGKISLEEGKEFLSNYRSGLYGYTYLE